MELRDLLLQAVPSGNREGKGRDGYRSKVAGQEVRFPLGLQKGTGTDAAHRRTALVSSQMKYRSQIWLVATAL